MLDVYLTRFAVKGRSRRTVMADVVAWAARELGLGEADFEIDGDVVSDELRGRWLVEKIGGRPAIDVTITQVRDGGLTVLYHVEVVGADRPLLRAAVSVRSAGGTRGVEVPEGLYPPKVVSEIVERGDAIDRSNKIESEPKLIEPHQLDALFDMLTGDRNLPVTCFSVDRHNQDIDPNAVARLMAGAAHPVLLTAEASWRFTQLKGKEWSTFNGAVRVYRAGLDWNRRPRLHPIFIPYLNSQPEQIAELARHACVRDAHFRGLDDWSIPQERLRRLREQMADGSDEVDEFGWLDLLESVESERDELRLEVESMRAALESGEDELAGEPKSVLEALKIVAKEEIPGLVLLEAAWESAERASFGRPERALQILQGVAELAQAYHLGTLDTDFKTFLRQRGVTLGYVSPHIRGLYPEHYRRRSEGKTVELSDHAKVGTGPPTNHFRVYWYRDSENRNLVVGHVGDHLPNKM